MLELETMYCKADHPMTPLNPDPYFKVKECKMEGGKLYVRGEHTMWFATGLCKFYTEKEALVYIREFEEMRRNEERLKQKRGAERPTVIDEAEVFDSDGTLALLVNGYDILYLKKVAIDPENAGNDYLPLTTSADHRCHCQSVRS